MGAQPVGRDLFSGSLVLSEEPFPLFCLNVCNQLELYRIGTKKSITALFEKNAQNSPCYFFIQSAMKSHGCPIKNRNDY